MATTFNKETFSIEVQGDATDWVEIFEALIHVYSGYDEEQHGNDPRCKFSYMWLMKSMLPNKEDAEKFQEIIDNRVKKPAK